MAGKGDQSSMNDKNDKVVFWGCFIALITTSFAFISRIYLCENRFETEFSLNEVQKGTLIGAGIWPFGISIIVFSLIIDKIGYRVAMFFSFACYAIYLVLACMAYGTIQGVEEAGIQAAQARGYSLLYLGSVILALGNGTVEAFINPVVATMFNKEKTKWLNILHAGWPGGLVVAGIITISMGTIATKGDWRLVIGLVALPAIVFLILLCRVRFPVQEREQAGVTYREMLSEFGMFGALVGFGLIFWQLGDIVPWQSVLGYEAAEVEKFTPEQAKELASEINTYKFSAVGIFTALVVIGFGIYTKSVGRPLMALLIIIMMPLATTEIGTDGWIMGLMKGPMKEVGRDAGWVLVYTSAIMMVLRFFAGPIVHKLSPLGLLIVSAILAIAGLYSLSLTGTFSGKEALLPIFAAATLYGIGKTFFWPTMLGVTSEQCPKGGTLTLNAISGIGMIAVGIIGFPLIGIIQANTATSHLPEATAEQVLAPDEKLGVSFKAIDPDKRDALTDEEDIAAVAAAEKAGQFNALAKMALFPAFMLVCYIAMFFYFKSKGGYKAVELAADEAIADGSIAGGEA